MERQKIKLRNLGEDLMFSVALSRHSNEITVNYENGEIENFSTPYIFLQDLDISYRNRIENSNDTEFKISLCNEFILKTQEYKLGFADKVYDRKLYEDEIRQHQEYFEIFKQNLIENKKVSAPNDKGYSVKQLVLILDYLGIIENLRKNNLTEKSIGETIAAITGKDETNILRAIRYNSRVVEKGSDETKTRTNLEVVKEFFTKLQLLEIANKIQEELNTLKKG